MRGSLKSSTIQIKRYSLSNKRGTLHIEGVLSSWKNTLSAESADDAKKNLDTIREFLELIANIVNGLTPTTNLTQTKIDTYKSDISTARSNINTAITNLSAAEEKFRSAKSTLTLEENQLALKKAGATREEIAGAEAQVERAEASVKNSEAELAKTVIRAPLDGIVTRQDAKVGEIAPPNTALVAMIGSSGFDIEANVPEADIAKIKLGDKALITLDAYGDEVIFNARVIKIDPAETFIEGVATYKVTFEFEGKDERIKSGMTANIDVATDKRENVVIVPQRAVIPGKGEKIVRVLNGNNTVREVRVKTGLRGSDGNVEIIEGLSGEESVILFEAEE